MLLDLALTVYIIVQLAQLDTFACCTDNKLDNSQCSYTNIGGSSNVAVNSNGFCIQKSTNHSCQGNITACADNFAGNMSMSELCSSSTLKEVANKNWDWLMAILVIKSVGLIFLIVLETRTLCHTKKKANDQSHPDRNREPGEEDVEDTVGCCDRCKHCSCECIKSCITKTTIFTLKVFFLIFGTAATTLAIWLLLYTNRVTFSSCDVLSDDTLSNQCSEVESNCTFGNGQNFYVVVFGNLNVTGPYIVDMVTSVSSTVLWLVRFAVLRYYLTQSKLTSV